MRRAIILLLLLGGMQLILPLGARGFGSQSLLTFGFLILAAYTVGELATPLRLPKILGYLLAGVLFGPSVLGTVSLETTRELAPVSSLAIALIAFLAGSELRWNEVKERAPRIFRILTAELSLAFVAIAALLLVLRGFVPFLADVPFSQAVVFSLLFASIAIVHSPAVTMALLTETGARGPVARTTLGVVLVSDVIVVVLFSAMLALTRSVVPPAELAATVSLGSMLWELGGAIIVGTILGGAIALYLRFVHRELFLFAILVAFFGSAIAQLAHVETLLTLLTAGFVTESLSNVEEGDALRHAMERSAAPVFVVFFALAGASMVLGEIARLWPIVIPIVLVRTLAIWGGTTLGARWAGVTGPEQRYVWLGLISQAGVAIGFATIVADVYPERGAQIRTLFLAVLAIDQTIGPILFRHALARSNELAPEHAPAEDAGTPPAEDQALRTV